MILRLDAAHLVPQLADLDVAPGEELFVEGLRSVGLGRGVRAVHEGEAGFDAGAMATDAVRALDRGGGMLEGLGRSPLEPGESGLGAEQPDATIRLPRNPSPALDGRARTVEVAQLKSEAG